jgi:Zn-dependent peptidase ImmA (M78 family)
MKHPGPEDAEAKAELWLREHGITSLPVDPFEIAERLEIEVRPKDDAEPGVSGMLLRHREAFGILYATHIKSIGFQRFSIGHELGHYLLAGHAEQLFPNGDGIHASRANFMSNVLHEREADHFACGLLMPDGPFRSALRRCGEGLEAIEALADKCLTSITATAIRYARKTSVPAAVVVSTDGQVDFSFLSGEMREFPGLTLPRKDRSSFLARWAPQP